jgi:acyl carrier protein
MEPSSIRTAVAAAIGELTGYPPEKIRDADDLARDLGVDSMVAMRLLVAVESRLGTTLPDGFESRFVGIATVADLVERLGSVLGPS